MWSLVVNQWSREVPEGWNVMACGSESGTMPAAERGRRSVEYDGESGAGEACQSPPMYGVWCGYVVWTSTMWLMISRYLALLWSWGRYTEMARICVPERGVTSAAWRYPCRAGGVWMECESRKVFLLIARMVPAWGLPVLGFIGAVV